MRFPIRIEEARRSTRKCGIKRVHRMFISRPLRPNSFGEAKPLMTQPPYNKDVLRGRSHAQQSPAIPREIDAYPHDKRANRCSGGPARGCSADGGAMPVGVSHHLPFDHAALGSLSPHGDFRTPCHVPQADPEPFLGNTFADVEDVRVTPRSQFAARATHAAQVKGHAMRGLLKRCRKGGRFRGACFSRTFPGTTRAIPRAIPDEQTHGQSRIVRDH